MTIRVNIFFSLFFLIVLHGYTQITIDGPNDLRIWVTKKNYAIVKAQADSILRTEHIFGFIEISGELDSIPDFLFEFTEVGDLEVLIAAAFPIDKRFNKLHNLLGLRIYSNVTGVLDGVDLPNLLSIDMPHYSGSLFPEVLCNWGSLTEISMEHGDFSFIPKSISNLKNLERLSLNTNKISELPDELFTLKKLRVIALNQTELREIDSRFCNLESLKELWISENKNLKISDHVRYCLEIIKKVKLYEDN